MSDRFVGTKNWQDSIAVENMKLLKENSEARRAWERDAIRFDEFRYGMHFSKAEEKELLAFRQAPLPISVTTAICDTAEALMTSNKPTVKTAPIINPYDQEFTNTSKKVSQIYNFLITKSWYDSLGGLQYDRVVRDYTNVGVGYFYVSPHMRNGQFNVEAKHMSWKYVYPHKMTKDPFYRDMDNCVIAMEISAEAGYKFVKQYERDLTRDQYKEDFVKQQKGSVGRVEPSSRYLSLGAKDNTVFFIQRLVLEEHKSYTLIPISSELVDKTVIKTVTELTDEHKRMINEGMIDYREDTEMFLTEYTSIGSLGYKTVYPIKNYNIVPLVYDHRDTPYPFGRIWYLYPLQRALNKFLMIAILNGSLMNTTKIIAEENSIVDNYEFDKNFSMPGGKLFWRRVMGNHSEPPIIVEGKPLSDAWLRMPEFIIRQMEYISGIFGAMMGDSNNSPDVFSTVAALQSAGGQKIKRRLAQADASLSIVGQVMGEFYKEYAPLNGFSTIIDDNGEQSEPQLYNRLRARKEDSSKIEIDPETDLSYGFNTVRFTTQASNGFESGTEAALLTNLATQLSLPQLVPLILKRLNIADVDKITEQLDLVQQQGGQIEQMGKAIQELEGRTKVLANQVVQKGFETSKAQFDAKLHEVLADVKQQVKDKQ
jgi:hypothetical protein